MYSYYLQLQSGSETAEQYPLTKERTVIGRHPSCDVMIPESAVSRQHAEIVLATSGSGTISLRDLGSRNGTYVNGEQVSGPVPLSVGDCISIGGLQLRLSALDRKSVV